MQAVRNIFWWLCFVALGICVQSLVPCLDALVVGLVILLQERDYKNLCWLLPLFVLLQEGIGTSPFGATIVWYALVCLLYRLLRWLLGRGNFFLVLRRSSCLGGACVGLGWLVSPLYAVHFDPQEFLDRSLIQALYLPVAWLLLTATRPLAKARGRVCSILFKLGRKRAHDPPDPRRFSWLCTMPRPPFPKRPHSSLRPADIGRRRCSG